MTGDHLGTDADRTLNKGMLDGFLGWPRLGEMPQAEPQAKRGHCGFYNPRTQRLYQLLGVLSRCFLLIDKELRLVFDR